MSLVGVRSFRRGLASKFAAQDDAASLAEYALLLGAVAVALVVVVSQYSGAVSSLLTRTTNTVTSLSEQGAGSGTASGGSGAAGDEDDDDAPGNDKDKKDK